MPARAPSLPVCANLEFGPVRIQILSPTLVRLELKGPRGFEDRPSFRAVQRSWPGAPCERIACGRSVELRTEGWRLLVPAQPKDLRGIQIRDREGRLLWAWEDGLGGSRALPAPGQAPQAWAVADTPRLIPPSWGATPAPAGADFPATSGWDPDNDALDVYVFLPGGDYARLRSDLLRLTGPTELPPLYLFGNFHSRYHAYSDVAALALIREYRERGFALDVFVVDTDWRVSAASGYAENRRYFPDMAGFLAKARQLGVRVGFNDHPEPVSESALDPAELRYRYDNLGHWLGQGVAFWWFDRNWTVTLREPMPGLAKEVWGMQVYRDATLGQAPELRPLILANADGIDNGRLSRPSDVAAHRFPFQWTGDTRSSWHAVRAGVENAVRLGVESLIPYLSEDLGGHVGIPSPELYVRFYQFGTLSAVVRPHPSNNLSMAREPWALGPATEAIARDYLRMRYRLLPHLYAAARRNADTGEPLLRRLDLVWPQAPEAAANDQYLLGDGLLVAPILEGESPTQPVPGSWLRQPQGAPGLLLEGFANENLLGQPVLHQAVPQVATPWSLGAVDSVRWSGTLTPDRPVQLGIRMDGGGRLWLDGRLVLDLWQPRFRNLALDPMTLEPGRPHQLLLEMRRDPGKPRCPLYFRPMDLPARPSVRSLWLPEGLWIDAWTGARFQGPRTLEVGAGPAVTPMFIRAGSLFPLAPDQQHTGQHPWDPVTLELFPHGDAPALGELYEDDGQSNGYRQGACRRTPLELRRHGQQLTVTLGPAAGTYPGALAARAWVLRLHRPPGLAPVQEVRVDGAATTAWRLIPQGWAATPFQLEGPALDGEVLEIRLAARPVTRIRRIEVA